MTIVVKNCVGVVKLRHGKWNKHTRLMKKKLSYLVVVSLREISHDCLLY